MTFSTPLNMSVEDGPGGKVDAAATKNVTLWQVSNVLVWILNVIAVALPGRLDGETQNQKDLFVAPAIYAFAIWGVIYLWELPFVVWQALQRPRWATAVRLEAVVAASPGWCAGNLSQVAWCIFFRQPFNNPGLLWLSAFFLSGIAVGLSFAHRALAPVADCQVTFLAYVPITLHFGWTTAAGLVNWNSWAILFKPTPEVNLALVVLSLVVATVVALGVGVLRGSVLYASTVAWAVIAVGVQTRQNAGVIEAFGASTANILGITEIVLGVGFVCVSAAVKLVKLISERSGSPRRAGRLGRWLRSTAGGVNAPVKPVKVALTSQASNETGCR